MQEGQDGIQTYFNDTASKVKATTDPAEKREILNKSLQTMTKALDKVQSLQLISKEDRPALIDSNLLLQENQDELNGSNGYERVSDVATQCLLYVCCAEYGTGRYDHNHRTCHGALDRHHHNTPGIVLS